MGWINETAPGCEGYLIGIVPATNPDGTKSDWRWRELSSGDGDNAEVRLTHVQMACDCGWRSQRLAVPIGTYWQPSIVVAPRSLEDAGYALWREHIDSQVAQRHRTPLRRSAALVGLTTGESWRFSLPNLARSREHGTCDAEWAAIFTSDDSPVLLS